jgi:flotillin
LKIYSCNIEELADTEGNVYFASRKQKALEGAVNDAKIDVSEARKRGNIGEKQRITETRQEVAKLESNAIVVENDNKQVIEESKMKLGINIAGYKRLQEIADIEAKLAAQNREIELLKELEEKRLQQQIASHRAKDVSLATIKAEAMVKEAEGQTTAIKLVADAKLYEEQKKAEGIKINLEAQSDGLNKLLSSTNNPNHALFYLAMNHGLYEKLAKENANAISGLQPKINIWNTGNNGNTDPMSSIKNIFTGLAPMLDVMQQQTDLKIPEIISKPKDSDKNETQIKNFIDGLVEKHKPEINNFADNFAEKHKPEIRKFAETIMNEKPIKNHA